MTQTPDGMRTTRQRTAVLRALEADDEFRTAQEWHEALRRNDEAVGLTTVYRTLAALAQNGAVDSIVGEDGEARYRRCDARTHHHHLVCRTCGACVELSAEDVEVWADAVARAHGYAEVSHTVEIFGICPSCRAQP